MKKLIGLILVVIVLFIVGAYLSCWIGTSIWNEMIADQFGWTEHISKWDFFKLEIMADSLLWLTVVFRGNSSKKND